MKYIILIILFPVWVWSQQLSLVETLPLAADTFIGIDSYKDIYYIKDQVFYKKNNINTFNFKDFQLGEIYSVDIINPMTIAVYYQDFNTVVLLDNKLSEIE